MASWIPTKPSLSSSNSLFLAGSGRGRSARWVSLASRSRGQRKRLQCRCFFGLGVPELAVIAGVTALVFGPKQLPEVGRSVAKTFKSFQQAAKEFEAELQKEPENTITPTLVEAPKAVSTEDEKALETSSAKDSA